MRVTTILLPTVVTLAIVGAFGAGHYIGRFDAEKVGETAMDSLDASRSAEAFLIASSARDALKKSQPAEADLILVRYAALKAPSLIECSASPSCAGWVGKLMPSRAQLEDAIAAERDSRGTR